METGLKNRVALVAGSSQGIGRATALAFAAEGANLALCARNDGALADLAAEAKRRHGVKSFHAKVDVGDDSAVRSFVQDAHKHFGRIDICVTNAGGPPAKQFAQTTMEDWDRAYALNLRSVVSFAQAVLPHMQQQKWGRLVTLTSISVKQPVPNLVLSNSIRTGVPGLVRTLAGEYGEFGITINNVGPGYTATDRLKELASRTPGATVEEYFATLARDVPLKRIAKPEEVADAIVWIASERASYITGQTILVDGGAYRGL
jgi:3-oxoacyl-[acyl-carrier protein] reductase